VAGMVKNGAQFSSGRGSGNVKSRPGTVNAMDTHQPWCAAVQGNMDGECDCEKTKPLPAIRPPNDR
jgi:hypothetical protein